MRKAHHKSVKSRTYKYEQQKRKNYFFIFSVFLNVSANICGILKNCV